ncbi:MAG TPA: Asp-tRNA(Asn)/Glu-tRNA(Gln) amidotransferase subunit GatA [Sphingobacteriaceae bacterium]
MEYATLSAIRQDLEEGRIGMQELIESYLARIEAHRELNAFLQVFADEARERAETVASRLKDGTAGKLAGLVIAIKDNICYAGHPATAGSKILSDYISPYSSTVVDRLLSEDAVIIGRLNCDEFGMGSSNENSFFGPVRNYADPTRVSGGSSGGSAVAVQANLCHAALGTDTGGSVRQPAAFCGIVGFKPTYGRISRYGIIAYASSFDQVGTLTRSVEDADLLLQVMAGPDGRDSTVSRRPVPVTTEESSGTGKKRIAVLSGTADAESADPEIRAAFRRAVTRLESQGHEIVTMDFAYLDYLVPTYYVLTMAEASSNLSRYDGVHYGYRSEAADSLESTYKLSRAEGFGKEVKRRILTGTFVLSSGYYDAYYAKAQKVRRLIRDKVLEILGACDFILLPSSPELPYPIGQSEKDPVVKNLADIYTVLASLAGTPAISLPIGVSGEGLPIGVQLVGRPFQEAELLAFSKNVGFSEHNV